MIMTVQCIWKVKNILFSRYSHYFDPFLSLSDQKEISYAARPLITYISNFLIFCPPPLFKIIPRYGPAHMVSIFYSYIKYNIKGPAIPTDVWFTQNKLDISLLRYKSITYDSCLEIHFNNLQKNQICEIFIIYCKIKSFSEKCAKTKMREL